MNVLGKEGEQAVLEWCSGRGGVSSSRDGDGMETRDIYKVVERRESPKRSKGLEMQNCLAHERAGANSRPAGVPHLTSVRYRRAPGSQSF
jgi:hypothetical protein